MASKTEILLIDDVDGSEASETIQFGVDGVEYEIDLNEENADALRSEMTAWVASARRISPLGGSRRGDGGPFRPAGRRRATASSPDALSREERGHLRTWAANNGYEIADRGRIAVEVQQAWIGAGRLEA